MSKFLSALVVFITYITTANHALAAKQSFNSVLVDSAESFLESAISFLSAILFFPIFGFPMLVLWLVIGGVFFTFRLGFVNIRLFKHAICVVLGKYDNKKDPGEVSHFQALTAAVSATVGIGNIGGVAIAITLGGPGAVFWMMCAGFVGMSTKFAEVTLGQKYRKIEGGVVSGGAFRYLYLGLKEKNMEKLGRILAISFAVLIVIGSFGIGNMFQANQTVTILTDTFTILEKLDFAIALAMAIIVGVVLIGGIKRIVHVTEKIVPFMAVLYIISALIVLFVNRSYLGDAIYIIFNDAFTGSAVEGGVIGTIINGFKRAAFSNEAGLGSAPTAHAAAKTKEPVREGCVALLEPFLDTIVICFMTGLVITVTGVYTKDVGTGVLMTSAAFSTVSTNFPIALSIAAACFAFSTMITWSYYGERSWAYLFGKKSANIYYILFCTAVFFGGLVNLNLIIDISDLFVLSMAVPNLIGLYILSGDIKKDLDDYIKKLKTGKFKST